ncbi:MAG: 6-phosphofructokinase [Oscillospiraceae bacterium]|nr:6-phosphofructokinase [Oscillospiraceae bacterium]
MLKTEQNAIVGQSGGPTAAINATLAGVVQGAFQNAGIDKIYGMINGMQGFLDGNVRILNDIFKNGDSLELLKNTPAAALGSCRLKLPDINSDSETYKRIFNLLDEKNIKFLFYIGGNDSMDTVKKLSFYAENYSKDVKIIGIPKTIDNDLTGTDHAPGYGSAAKYVATTIQEICHDSAIYDIKSATIVEIMGRDAGWLTAAAALPRLNCGEVPSLIYLPEIEFSDERFIADIEKEFNKNKNIVIAVSEGIKYADGRYICETLNSQKCHDVDIFGHKWLSGTADMLKYTVKERFGCKVRSIELNTPQRCASHTSSLCDLNESVEIGRRAVETAASGKSGVMMSFRRISTHPYKIEIDCEDIVGIANSIRTVPEKYISPDKHNVTNECLEYIQPLIIGEPHIVYRNGIPVYFKL